MWATIGRKNVLTRTTLVVGRTKIRVPTGTAAGACALRSGSTDSLCIRVSPIALRFGTIEDAATTIVITICSGTFDRDTFTGMPKVSHVLSALGALKVQNILRTSAQITVRQGVV